MEGDIWGIGFVSFYVSILPSVICFLVILRNKHDLIDYLFDCFGTNIANRFLCLSLQGCDASVLISSPNGDAKKDSKDNHSLAGDGAFDTVIKAKQAVEAACPEIGPCADILALAARDVVALVRTHDLISSH